MRSPSKMSFTANGLGFGFEIIIIEKSMQKKKKCERCGSSDSVGRKTRTTGEFDTGNDDV